MVILIFGQPASGKTTLAEIILAYNFRIRRPILIDGDKWRDVTNNKDYTKQGRITNLKGAFNMALYLEREDFTPILSFVTPYQELRDYLKENAKELLQVYLEYNEDRGRNQYFVKDFESPKGEVLFLNTSELTLENCCKEIIKYYVEQKSSC